jgi:filamentous hemagglutinin
MIDPERTELLDELARLGIRHTPADVIGIQRTAEGRIIFLETGNRKAGLQHIRERHGRDFENRGILPNRIAAAVMAAVARGRRVGEQRGRPIFEVEFDGMTQYISVNVGDNGFIIGANPTPRRLIPAPPGSE